MDITNSSCLDQVAVTFDLLYKPSKDDMTVVVQTFYF